MLIWQNDCYSDNLGVWVIHTVCIMTRDHNDVHSVVMKTWICNGKRLQVTTPRWQQGTDMSLQMAVARHSIISLQLVEWGFTPS